MNAKQLESVSGPVEAVNAKGIKVLGEWANVSLYHPINPMPTQGELVELQLERTDRGCWINTCKIVGGQVSLPPGRPFTPRQ